MLGFMPRLYEDELIYSWLARYHLYSGNDGPKLTMGELFGQSQYLAVPDLPTNLDLLARNVSHFKIDDSNKWLTSHTFFNYYTNFLSVSTKENVRKTMLFGENRGTNHMVTGMMASSVKENTYFRFCPDCVKEDIESNGETYWRVGQQLPGVLFCIKHNQILCNSQVRFRQLNKHVYVAATLENCIVKSYQNTFDLNMTDHLKSIAQELHFLSGKELIVTCDELEHIYQVALQNKGLASINGTVDQDELTSQFLYFYGKDVLLTLQSETRTSEESCWLKAITRKHRKAFHPIRHALFLRFLGISLTELESINKLAYKPFGEGPFPCLNAAADHYKDMVIDNVKVTRCNDTKRPVGTFICKCGFEYTRRGPDTYPTDKYRIGRVKEFGPIWHMQLQQLLYVDKFSFRKVAKILHVDTNTVIKYATYKPEKLQIHIQNDLVELKKSLWLELCANNPVFTVTQLRKSSSALYKWLYRNCKEWLVENSPKSSLKIKQIRQVVDWVNRDEIFAVNISQEVVKAWDPRNDNKPFRITVSRLGYLIGSKALLERHIEKLPICNFIVSEVKESFQDFDLRKIRWAIKQLKDIELDVSAWRVRRLAGITRLDNEAICSAIKINFQYEV